MRQENYEDIIKKANIKRKALGVIIDHRNFCPGEIEYERRIREEGRKKWFENGYDLSESPIIE